MRIQIHDQGLVTVLRQIHDELDQAVLEAYGWEDMVGRGGPAAPTCPPKAESHGEPGRSALPIFESTEQELLTRLVALNIERAAEEKRGLIRKLLAQTPPAPETGSPELAETLSAHFGRRNKNRTEQIEGILETLKGLGQL